MVVSAVVLDLLLENNLDQSSFFAVSFEICLNLFIIVPHHYLFKFPPEHVVSFASELRQPRDGFPAVVVLGRNLK